MSGFIDYAIQRVQREIPEELLYRAFGTNSWHNAYNRLSIEEKIRREVLAAVVLPDCNIVGGESFIVDVSNLPWQWLDNLIRIEIPLNLTMNRHIFTILSVETTYQNSEPYGPMPGQPSPTGDNDVYLVGPNTIVMKHNPGTRHVYLRCLLENDQQLANLNPRAMYLFGDLTVLAAKGIIHNKLAINTTITAMSGGQVDGRLRGIIDGYSDAFTMYGEMLTKRWKKVFMLQDRKWHNRLIGMGIMG